MIVNRDAKQNLKEKTFAKWNQLADDLQFYVGLFLTVDDAFLFQFVSKYSLSLMNEIWKPRFNVHFSFDVPRLERRGKSNTSFVSEYKKCYVRDNTEYHSKNRYRYITPRPTREILLLNLFKEGKLAEIKQQIPSVTLKTLFNICDSQRRCLIQWAGKNSHQTILDYFYMESLKQYPEHSDINHCTGLFNAPRLYWAACFNQVYALDQFLEAKEISINAITDGMETALHVAAFMGNNIIVNKLIAANATINVQDGRGKTPCYQAAYAGSSEIVTSLLNARAEINNLVQWHPYPWLNREGSGNTPLMKACELGNYEMAIVLLKAKANVNAMTNDGNRTALYRAVQYDQQEMLPLLIEAKAEVNMRDAAIGDYLIHMTVSQNNLASTQLLLENKADVNAINRHGYSALSFAALNGNTQLVQTLLNTKAAWPYDSGHSSDWPFAYIFDPHTELKHEIRKVLVIAELNQHLTEMKEHTLSFVGMFTLRYKQALEELLSAVQSGANLYVFENIKKSYSWIFSSKKYKDIYNRACSVLNPDFAECHRQCTRGRI